MISENRTMRKIYIGMIILCMFLGLSSCKTNSDTESDAAKQTGNKTISDVEEAKSHNLSDKELEQIKFLIQLMRSAESISVSTHIGEGRVLRSAKEQFEFIKALNERDKTEFMQDLFKDYINFNEDKMTISKDNATTLLMMAGAKEDKGAWEYIIEEKERYQVNGDTFTLSDDNRIGSELISEYKNWSFDFQDDDTLRVRCQIFINPEYGHAYNLEAILYKNDKSVFAGYSVAYIIVNYAQHGETEETFLSDFEASEYVRPDNLGSSFEDYTFSMDGKLYKMPIPLGEILQGGWQLDEELPDDRKRKEVTLKKEGEEIFCILWKDKNKDWYVVELKTQVEENLANVDFELFNNIKRGEEKRKDKQYDFYDPLYFDYFRIRTFFDENNVAEGFEIRYAPEYIDRVKRLEALCENMTKEVLEVTKEATELKWGVTYRLSNEEKEVSIQLRRLNKVDWSRYTTAIFIVEKEKTTILPLIEYNAKFTLCVESADNIYIKVEGYDTAVHPEPQIIDLKERY